MKSKKAFTLAEVLITLGIIGIVAALTIPGLIIKYEKQKTVSQLKKAYTVLYQSINSAKFEYGDIESWDYPSTGEEYAKKYILPYLKYTKSNHNLGNTNTARYYTVDIQDGIEMSFAWDQVSNFARVLIDLNGGKKPNRLGKDRFSYYVFHHPGYHNAAEGNLDKGVNKGGLYPDGIGFSREELLNYEWRGCISKTATVEKGAFCTALIMYDGWEIKDDYPW